MDVRSIAQALEVFKANNGHYPPSLQALTERQPNGGPVLLAPRMLLDPWRQPYRYDPQQLHPETGVPLVWSDGVPGQSDGKITNWQEAGGPSVWDILANPIPSLTFVAAIWLSLLCVRCRYFKEELVRSRKAKLAQVALDIAVASTTVLLVAGLWFWSNAGVYD
jgi:hypothetical protein